MAGRFEGALLTRRTFVKLLGILALAACLLGPEMVLGSNGKEIVFRLRTGGTRKCRACKRHTWYKVARTRELADANRAHAGCNCPITEQRVSHEVFQQLFPDPTGPGVVDLRQVRTLPAPASLQGRVVLPGRSSFQGVHVALVGRERLAATTDSDGEFAFAQLVPGRYRLRAADTQAPPNPGHSDPGRGRCEDRGLWCPRPRGHRRNGDRRP